MKTKLLVLALFVLFILAACTPLRYDGPYKGRVVDTQTGNPIEGAVVLGTWVTVSPTAGGGVSKYYDAVEAITDKNGNFEIKGQGLLFFTTVESMHVLIFKAGYEYIGSCLWNSFKEDKILAQKITWDGDRAVVHIWKLTMEERKKRLFGKEPIPDNKQLLLIRELNKERTEIGLQPYSEVR